MVFATRANVVCLLMGSTMTIRMQCLAKEEAWNLFKRTVGRDTLDSHPHIKSLAIRVVDECGGLPLALVVMGRTMSTKRTLQEWEDVLLRLERSKFNESMEGSIFWILEFCYDSLQDEKIKDCFICCSLWHEVFRIEKDKLILSWMGFGLIDAFDDINKAYEYGYSIIDCLVAAGLLEQVQDDNNVVKMHDIVRDLALWIASDHGKERHRWVVIAGGGLEKVSSSIVGQWKNAERISLMCNKIAELNSTLAAAYCPNLLSLSLQYNRLTEMPAGLHRCMPNLTFLDLSANYKLKKIPIEIGCLVQLRYLNLSYTKISSLPEELWQLQNLKYLLLRHTRKLVSIPSRMLSSPSNLEILDMYPHGICSSDELAYLPRGLKALGVKVTTAQNFQQLSDLHVPIIGLNMHDMGDSTSIHLHMLSSITQGCLQELKISECDNIRELVMDVNSLPRLKTLVLDRLENMREIIWNNAVPSECFRSLQVLNIYRCHGLKNITWVLHLPGLDYLSVKECDRMEQLIVNCDTYRQDGEEVEWQVQLVGTTSVTFPSLKSLRLLHLPKLSGISSDYTALNFPYLERVEIFNCPELRKLPFLPRVNCRKLNSIKCQRTWWEGIQWEAGSITYFHFPGAKVCNIEFNTLEDPDNNSEFDSSLASDNSIDGSKPEMSSSNVRIQVVQGKTGDNRITEQEMKSSQLRPGPNFNDKWLSLEVLYSNIKEATNGLHKSLEIGKGGYGNVYKGKLGKTMVAIKVLNSTSKQGEKEFFQELEVLYQMRHPNLVKLEGACFEVRALVYEFLPNGSLEDCLKYNPNILTWQMRTRIIHEICSALIYLHSKSVVHGDLKPANILLDANFKSKLSDFGLCRFLPEEMTTAVYLETVPKGTTGYVDPWFLETWILRPGSDLYSFGITILKLLTGMQPVGLGVKARDADEDSFHKMIDPTAGSWPFEFAKELLYWSLQCCCHNEKSFEVLKDMSTCLKEMLTEIETFQEGRFKVAVRQKKEANDSLNAEEKKDEEMREEEKPKPEDEKVEPVLIAVVLKVHIHSEAYAQEITTKILRLEGVHTVELALKASEVKVKGVFDLLKLVDYVQREVGKPVDIAKVELVGKKPEEEKGKEQEKTKNEKNDDNAKEVNE